MGGKPFAQATPRERFVEPAMGLPEGRALEQVESVRGAEQVGLRLEALTSRKTARPLGMARTSRRNLFSEGRFGGGGALRQASGWHAPEHGGFRGEIRSLSGAASGGLDSPPPGALPQDRRQGKRIPTAKRHSHAERERGSRGFRRTVGALPRTSHAFFLSLRRPAGDSPPPIRRNSRNPRSVPSFRFDASALSAMRGKAAPQPPFSGVPGDKARLSRMRVPASFVSLSRRR